MSEQDDTTIEPVSRHGQSGPADWHDVPEVQRALEVWAVSARVDFQVSEDLFYALLDCSGKDDDFFTFQPGQVRFKDWRETCHSSSHASRKQLAAMHAAVDLAFPITLSQAARWYCEANTLTACSLPDYVPEVLAAKDYAAARSILQDAYRKAKADLDEKNAALLSTPEKPAMAQHQAKRDRDEAWKREQAVRGCQEALCVSQRIRSEVNAQAGLRRVEKKTRERSGDDAIRVAMKVAGATVSSQAADLEPEVRKELLKAAEKDTDGSIGFKKDENGCLTTLRKKKWLPLDDLGLKKRIQTQLGKWGD